MPSPRFVDEVLVVLTTLDAPATCPFRERFLLLTNSSPSATIGRTSKRRPDLGAAVTNAWIDSAVMSRKHAVIKFDPDLKRVYVKDVGSLHGTFHNGTRLAPDYMQQLKQGDILKFGISVERGAQTFPPCLIKVTLHHGTEPRPQDEPVVFRVPDDSDLDDVVSDDDFSIRNSARILRENGVGPAKPAQLAESIDLTSDGGEAADKCGSSKPQEKDITASDQTWTSTRQGQMETPPTDDSGRQSRLSNADEWQRHDKGLQGQDSPCAPRPTADKASDQGPSLHDSFDVGGVAEWDDDYSSVPSASAPPASHDCSVAALAGTSDNEPRSAYDGDEAGFEPGDAFGLGHGSMPSLGCDHDDAEAEQPMWPHASKVETRTKTGTEPESPMVQDAEQPAQYCCDPLTTVKSGARAEQSAIQSSRFETGPSSAPTPERLHLPPIAVMGAIAPATPQPALQSTAEVLGPRTGKFEFFAARDANRAMVGLASRGSADEPRRQAAAQASCSPGDYDEDFEDDELDSSFLDPDERQIPLADATTSTLLASGAKFLSWPPREPDGEPVVATSPELDETSAYQFELSKKAAGANGAACRRTHVAIQDLVDAYPENVVDEGRPWQKRKADCVSNVTGEGQGDEGGAADGPAADGPAADGSAANGPAANEAGTGVGGPAAARGPVVVGAADESRPTKRFRRAAEVLGYAALGGVAVMSALIATAPTL